MRTLPLLLLAACGLTPEKFDDRFEDRYCVEYSSCFGEDFDCDDDGPGDDDHSGCTFNATAAQACLDGQWACVTSQGLPFVQIPVECADAYTNCDEETETIYYGTGTGTGSGG